MDFNDTPEEAEFRAEVRAWLDANARLKTATPQSTSSKASTRGSDDEAEFVRRSKEWQAKKADAGWACITWPEDCGGRGGTTMQNIIYQTEEIKYDVPRGFYDSTLGMCGPTLLLWADEETKKKYIPAIVRGEDVWCQLFSEPSAGSDLAALRTSARLEGDTWIVNGQKVWTSWAHHSTYAVVVTRSDFKVPKHQGMTYFYLDMRSPGIEVRPLRQINGGAHFCEVFLNDVRIPDSQRLGEVGQGWRVALSTLMNERMNVATTLVPDVDELLRLAREVDLENGKAIDDPYVRERIAEWWVQARGLEYTRYRSMTALSRGQTPGPEASINKIVAANKMQAISSYGMELLDMGGVATGADVQPQSGLFQQGFLQSPGARVGGGTDEIMMNIIAERVLGLPGDIRIDKTVPFDEIPTGSAN